MKVSDQNKQTNKAPKNKNKKKKSSKAFVIIYTVFVVLAIAAIVVLAVYLRGVLAKYEKSIPKYSLDDVFIEIFGDSSRRISPDYERLMQSAGIELTPFEDKGTFKSLYDNFINKREVTFREVSNGLSKSRKFVVLAGDKQFGYFIIDPTDQGGFSVGEVAIDFISAKESVIIKALEGDTVTVNGVALDDTYLREQTASSHSHSLSGILPDGRIGKFVCYEVKGLYEKPQVAIKRGTDGSDVAAQYDEVSKSYTDELLLSYGTLKIRTLKSSHLTVAGSDDLADHLINNAIMTDSCDHVPEGTDGIIYFEYSFDWIGSEPAFSCRNRSSEQAEFTYDEANSIYVEKIAYDEDALEENTEYILTAVQTYAKYMTCDASSTRLESYFDKKTKLFSYILTADTWTNSKKHSYSFSDDSVSDLYWYSDDVYSVNVKFTQKIVDNHGSTEIFPFDQTVYFRRSGKKFLIYDMVPNL